MIKMHATLPSIISHLFQPNMVIINYCTLKSLAKGMKQHDRAENILYKN